MYTVCLEATEARPCPDKVTEAAEAIVLYVFHRSVCLEAVEARPRVA